MHNQFKPEAETQVGGCMQIERNGTHYEVAISVVWPLIRLASRFGVYFWISAFLTIGLGSIVGLITGSSLGAFLFGAFSWHMLGNTSRHADAEYVFNAWAKEVARG